MSKLKHVLPVLWIALLLGLGVRGLVREDARYAWGMFPYVARYTVEYRWVLTDGTTRAFKPGKEIKRARSVFRPGKELDHWYGLGAVRTELVAYGTLIARDASRRPRSAVAFEIVWKWRKHDAAADEATLEVIRVPVPGKERAP